MNNPTSSPQTTNKLQDAINKKGVLLADGATGTNLFAMGLQTGDSPELWNTDHPDRIYTMQHTVSPNSTPTRQNWLVK